MLRLMLVALFNIVIKLKQRTGPVPFPGRVEAERWFRAAGLHADLNTTYANQNWLVRAGSRRTA